VTIAPDPDIKSNSAGVAIPDAPRRAYLPGWFGAWRFAPVDTYPRVVAFAQEPVGKVVLLIVFAVLFRPLSYLWLPITIGAGACAFAGRYRAQAVTVVTLGALVVNPSWFGWTAPSLAARGQEAHGIDVNHLRWVMLTVVLVISWAAIHCVRRFPDLILARRPVLTLVTTVLGLLLIAASSVLHGVPQVLLWSFLATFAAYLWFLCYALADQRSKDASSPVVRLGAFHPVWGPSTTPFGKGVAYLKKIEAKNPLELAVTQLKGVKLLAWVWVLKVISDSLRGLALSGLHIPTFEATFAQHVAGNPYPWYLCWGSILYTFFSNLLRVAIWGHTHVAVGRLAGYRLLRNSYRPLSSRTLADFWNRYYYYYKELLVDFYFFPAFLRYFKKHKRLRVFFATFMAAGVGNFIFHFIRDNEYVAEVGFRMTVIGYQTLAFYCVVLSIGIGLSQIRSSRGRTHRGWVRGQLMPSLGVMLFYCLLEVFMITYSPHSLSQRFSFLLHLFGVDAWI
jgi:hypothetical protein